jgi:hypothetical protein
MTMRGLFERLRQQARSGTPLPLALCHDFLDQRHQSFLRDAERAGPLFGYVLCTIAAVMLTASRRCNLLRHEGPIERSPEARPPS